MRKLVLLLFSSWLVFAGSCSIKDLALHGMDRTDVQSSILPVNKATAGLAEASTFSQTCAKNLTEFTSAVLITPVQLLVALPDFTLQTILLLVSLVFLYRDKFFNKSTPVLHKYNSRLYLHLKRIQIYA